jgi:acetyl-CoA carboxylase biotin carboxyl carrier protein
MMKLEKCTPTTGEYSSGASLRRLRGGGSTAGAGAAPASAPAAGADIPANAVVSPMVGTAYLSPEPGAAPFARPGDRVSEGQTLLIIEAMKVMNPIKSPRAGTVKAVLIQNAEPVEYGQPLIVVE